MFYKNNDSLDQYQFWIEIFLSIWPMLENDSQEYNWLHAEYSKIWELNKAHISLSYKLKNSKTNTLVTWCSMRNSSRVRVFLNSSVIEFLLVLIAPVYTSNNRWFPCYKGYVHVREIEEIRVHTYSKWYGSLIESGAIVWKKSIISASLWYVWIDDWKAWQSSLASL